MDLRFGFGVVCVCKLLLGVAFVLLHWFVFLDSVVGCSFRRWFVVVPLDLVVVVWGAVVDGLGFLITFVCCRWGFGANVFLVVMRDWCYCCVCCNVGLAIAGLC